MKLYEVLFTNSENILERAIKVHEQIEHIQQLKRKLNYLYKIGEYGKIEQLENTLKTMGVN